MNIEEKVEKLDELGLIRKNKIVGDYYQIYCPLHNDGNERRPSSGILLHDETRNGKEYPAGFWHCFTCQRAMPLQQLIDEIIKQRGIHSAEVLNWVNKNITNAEIDTNFDYLIDNRDAVKKLNSKLAVNYMSSFNKKETKYVSEDELKAYRYTTQYMYDRKLTDEVIAKFDVGVDLNFIPPGRKRKKPTITFPVRDEKGRTLFIYRRSIADKNFFMPQGIEKPVYGLYELPKGVHSVIICESIFNALTCYVYNKPALALLGTGTPAQINKLKLLGISEFVIGLDPDEAGERGYKKLKRALSSIAFVKRMPIPEGKDINDLTKEEFDECYAERY